MPIRANLEDRFFAKVIKGRGCWKWTAAKTERGYGVITRGRRGEKLIKAHRASWLIHFGDIPRGMSVAHRCNNQECCNPKHLYLATHAENMRDAARDGLMKQSPDFIEQRAAQLRGRKHSEEHKAKLSAARKKWWATISAKKRKEFCAMRGQGLKRAWAEGRR